jgi:hypothetical protein
LTFLNGGNSCVSGVTSTYGNGECVNFAGCLDGDGGEFEGREVTHCQNTYLIEESGYFMPVGGYKQSGD